jgi:prephenate dehydrogenase
LERLETVAIVGVGLIGGSIGLALRARGRCEHVIGIGRNDARLREAVALGAIDEATTSLSQGVARADVVVVCTPVTRIADDVRQAAVNGPERVLITDAGSTKQGIVQTLEHESRTRAVFVGGHPLAGSDSNGVAHARADLFEGRACVLTPTPRTPADRLGRARSFWSDLGCRLIELDPAAHDAVLALTSHLPHVVAAALAAVVPGESLGLAAGAYRDCTRVAKADASLWAGIFLENRLPLLEALGMFQDQLAYFLQALQSNDRDTICSWWDAARTRRLQFDTEQFLQGVKD